MQGVTESLAGRVAVFRLLPLSVKEAPKVGLLRGGFPEVIKRPSIASIWYRSYVQTYLERDVRAVSDIRDLATFRRFIALLVSRCGQMLNKTDLAAPLGVSVPTITQWLSILEITGQIVLVAPFFQSFGKRLVKTPKLYFIDSGLACFLLGIDSERALRASPFHGPLFEGHVASEIVKWRLGAGRTQFNSRPKEAFSHGQAILVLYNLGTLHVAPEQAQIHRPTQAGDPIVIVLCIGSYPQADVIATVESFLGLVCQG